METGETGIVVDQPSRADVKTAAVAVVRLCQEEEAGVALPVGQKIFERVGVAMGRNSNAEKERETVEGAEPIEPAALERTFLPGESSRRRQGSGRSILIVNLT